MKSLTLICLASLASVSAHGNGLRYGRPERQPTPAEVTDGPLVLSGMPAEDARAASKVSLPGWGNAGYSGFFVTNPASTNHMFFWYFPKPNAPLLIWLQGGPGGSSMFGLFAEMGPFNSDASLKLVKRDAAWTSKYAMLFIDNPVGAGFSFTTSDSGYCNDTKECVASNLFSLLTQFYGVFPEMLQQELYITGESYGGHYVPGFAAYIDAHNERVRRGQTVEAAAASQLTIPLAGMAIGDGWIDPVNMIPAYPDMIYSFGLCDEREKAKIQQYCDSAVSLIKAGKMLEAFNVWDEFLNGDVWPYGNYFHNITGLNDYDNYLNTNAPADFDYYAPYLNQPEVRAALHVGNATFPSNPTKCEFHLLGDFMVSFVDELVTLLNAPQRYKVLIYSGQLDVIIGAALTQRFLPGVAWHGQAAFNAAPKAVWRVKPTDLEVAGYARMVGNFTQVVVRGAGHIVPGDQPERALDMISRFVEGRGYKSYPDPAKPTGFVGYRASK